MSNLDRQATPSVCGGRGFVVAEPVRELLAPRHVRLGESTEVRRLLPNLGRRMVGAWAFVDHYGPDDIADEPGMQVPPHPHMGLQTVSWLHEGEVLHRDSLGSLQTVRPRELGLMTSGRAISHSEESPRSTPVCCTGRSSGCPAGSAPQRRTALPAPRGPARRHRARPGGHRHPRRTGRRGLARHRVHPDRRRRHHAERGRRDPAAPGPRLRVRVLSMSGEAEVDGVPVLPGSMLYLGCGRTELPCAASPEPV